MLQTARGLRAKTGRNAGTPVPALCVSGLVRGGRRAAGRRIWPGARNRAQLQDGERRAERMQQAVHADPHTEGTHRETPSRGRVGVLFPTAPCRPARLVDRCSRAPRALNAQRRGDFLVQKVFEAKTNLTNCTTNRCH